jgi:hypothetical protein
MLALAVVFLFLYVASAAKAVKPTTDTIRLAKDALHQAQPYVGQALEYVRQADLVGLLTALARYLPALLTGQAGSLPHEVQAAGQAALAWVVLGFVVLSIASMIVSLGLRLAKLGIMVALLVALVNFGANKDYLMASLGF